MEKQYLSLNIESDTFKGMKLDFNELLQQLLKKLHDGKISDGCITMQLKVSLEEVWSSPLGRTIVVPMFKHKTKANYTETLENGGAVSLPNTCLVYDKDLGEYVMVYTGGQQDLFGENGEPVADSEGETLNVPAIPASTEKPLQIRDPLCNDCGNRDTAACDQCANGSMWEPVEP